MQSIANWFAVAMRAPVQRMELESISGPDGEADKTAWKLLEDNDFDDRAETLFTQMMVHPRAIMSVSKAGAGPRIRVENCRRVYLHPDPDDPFRPAWAVKRWTENQRPPTQLWVPDGVSLGGVDVAVVYDDRECIRFEKEHTDTVLGQWRQVRITEHGLGALPFVDMALDVDADGVPHSHSQDLIPMQDAINTIRFNSLLAMQFSAYRQRVATGYDPVLRDGAGNVVYVKNEAGEVIVGPDGQPVPQLRRSGRPGVDRFLVFPGKDTKVFDLAESNLANYMSVYNRFLTDFFSKSSVPPQYALDKMANLSGDALAGAEAALLSLVADLKRSANSGIRRVLRLCDVAQGQTPANRTVEWADTSPKSLGQIVDAVVKLVSADFPHEAAWDMLPGATPKKIDHWKKLYDGERESAVSDTLLAAFTGPGPVGVDVE
ncbi:MAG: phage portal protein [Gordonia sp. (in: high G+C Gram-positive bacteria)]|uniref:phage portal protein n=1 Tax=Gordonia sp. (in: high G+C Gram-positive bacteria) TaxID=84139 RepID=UPI0039E3BAFC